MTLGLDVEASTLVIRAMTVGEVRLKDWWRVGRREIMAGFGPHGLRAGYTRAADTKGNYGTAAAPLTISGSGTSSASTACRFT